MLTSHQSLANAKTAANELVLESAALKLPDGIAAFFYSMSATPTQREGITAAHQAFCNRYARSHAATPLVAYDPEEGGGAPFREVNM